MRTAELSVALVRMANNATIDYTIYWIAKLFYNLTSGTGVSADNGRRFWCTPDVREAIVQMANRASEIDTFEIIMKALLGLISGSAGLHRRLQIICTPDVRQALVLLADRAREIKPKELLAKLISHLAAGQTYDERLGIFCTAVVRDVLVRIANEATANETSVNEALQWIASAVRNLTSGPTASLEDRLRVMGTTEVWNVLARIANRATSHQTMRQVAAAVCNLASAAAMHAPGRQFSLSSNIMRQALDQMLGMASRADIRAEISRALDAVRPWDSSQ